METNKAVVSKEVILPDSSIYTYSVKPVMICNALGYTISTVYEYVISDRMGLQVKLYRTRLNTWYDIPEAEPCIENRLLLSLKLAIDQQFKM